ncbi:MULTISPECIES: hypothetical protein [unclassified Mesorhizobium]|uniref:hypothetical protein n=1 Tax=unclassified Mesorhizobium TaxID=325217 RepID=UPI0012E3738F|nr:MULTISPECIES: hypothetical protein [unclassified Mesorhizobium]
MRILSIVPATDLGDGRFPCVAKFDAELTPDIRVYGLRLLLAPDDGAAKACVAPLHTFLNTTAEHLVADMTGVQANLARSDCALSRFESGTSQTGNSPQRSRRWRKGKRAGRTPRGFEFFRPHQMTNRSRTN